jgi:hypothetical protein
LAIRGNRRDANPIVINLEGPDTKLNRLSFVQRDLKEKWLQDLIERHPDILPVSEIEPAFAPLVSVGYEVPTTSGSIDNLFLSPQGYITIAETKLWVNPEARREVVGQIVDYAKDVSQWSFEELESKVRNYNTQRHKRNEGIMDSLRRMEDIDQSIEPIIVDTITRNLRNGRFLLLVVGDGIRESVESMADYLQQTPQLHFTLALVELQVYELPGEVEKPLLVIPQIVARTREITRAVVRVEGKAIESVEIGIDTEIMTNRSGTKRFTLTEEDYFSTLSHNIDDPADVGVAKKLKEDMEKEGCITVWRQASFVITLPDPRGSGQVLSLLIVYKNGTVQLSELANQLRTVGLPEGIALDYANEYIQMFSGIQMSTKSGYPSRGVTFREIRLQYDKFESIIKKAIGRIREAAKE